MSARIFATDTLFTQRILACAGFYKGSLDGSWGHLTEDAYHAHLSKCDEIKNELGAFDARSEANIASLLPQAQRKARSFMHVMAGRDLKCVILSGTRTYAEQNALYGKRPKVTNARGGQSNHNFGIAWDIGLFRGGQYLTGATRAEDREYEAAAKIAKAHVPGIEWGGDWKSFPDAPHYQLVTDKSLSAVRLAFEAGKPFV